MSNTNHPTFKYDKAAFLLTAKTNLHPGAGSESYGVIDNLIQRDATSGFPTINSTSLKGALREYFEEGLSGLPPDMVPYIFGADQQRNQTAAGAGNYRFFAADIVSVPVRSDKKLYVNLTCKDIAKKILDTASVLGITFTPNKKAALEQVRDFTFTNGVKAWHFEDGLGTLVLEENDTMASAGSLTNLDDVKAIFGNDIVIATNDVFLELTGNLHLPVVARNQLNNGISENLWYEQILPRETRFWFPVLHPQGNGVTNYATQFASSLVANPVQVGANASVGYGFCKIEQFPA